MIKHMKSILGVLLTVHLGIILAIDQVNILNLVL